MKWATIYRSVFLAGLFCLFTCHMGAVQTLPATSWRGELPAGFSVSLALSGVKLDIADSLVIDITLHYPKQYQPQLDSLRKALLFNYELAEPPFAFIREAVEQPKDVGDGILQQRIAFTLAPQMTGTHAVALRSITFLPVDGASGEARHLLTPVFKIEVAAAAIDFKPEELVAPLMPLTQELPITLSTTNRRRYTYNSELAQRQAQYAVYLLQSKAFPWLSVLLALVLGIVWLLIKYAPKSAAVKDMHPVATTLPPEVSALQAVDGLSTAKSGTSFFHGLDHTVRVYIKERYHVDLLSSTTQESIETTRASRQLPEELKSALINFFEENDKRKFTDYHPETEDYLVAEQAVRAIIQAQG